MTPPTAAHSAALLHRITHLLGPRYGSSEICHFLYAIVKMHRPSRVVELGAGLGVSTYWMALALAELGAGQIWTVDDFSHYPGFRDDMLPAIPPELDALGFALPDQHTGEEYFRALGALLGLSDTVEVLSRHVNP